MLKHTNILGLNQWRLIYFSCFLLLLFIAFLAMTRVFLTKSVSQLNQLSLISYWSPAKFVSCCLPPDGQYFEQKLWDICSMVAMLHYRQVPKPGRCSQSSLWYIPSCMSELCRTKHIETPFCMFVSIAAVSPKFWDNDITIWFFTFLHESWV